MKLAASKREYGNFVKRAHEAQDDAKELEGLFAGVGRNGSPRGVSSGDAKQESNLANKILELNKDPDVMRLLTAEQDAQIRRRYGALFKKLGLSADQSDALTALLVDKRQAATDVALASAAAGGGLDPGAYSNAVSAARNEVDQQIQSLLGQDGYSAFVAYDQQQGQMDVISKLQQTLANADVPLTESQVAQLQQTMQDNHIGHVSPKVISQASQYLTPDQVSGLQQVYQEQQISSELKSIQGSNTASAP
jgi:hypothetical protein